MYEISSESDDDSYNKYAQKLRKLKNKYALNNLLKIDLADDDETIKDVSLINRQDSDLIPVPDLEVVNGSTNLIPIELDSPNNTISARARRSKRKNSDVDFLPETQKGRKRSRGRGRKTSIPVVPQPRGRGRQRGRGTQNLTNCESITVAFLNPSPRRSSRRIQAQHTPSNSESIITYSIGNTDDYPDASDDQVLFSNNNIVSSEPSDIINLDDSLDNEELSVKVYWQHSEVFKFYIRRLQKLTQIFDFFVNKEGVSRDCLLFTYNYKGWNKILRPHDTPDSIDYNIAKFIEGGIVNNQVSMNEHITPQKKGFILKFQCQNRKNPVELSVGKYEKLTIAMVRCAELLEIPIAKLVFEFDGEIVQGNKTPDDLDMDSGDCIDVKIRNVN